jgi:hypothetical protein
MPVINVDGKIAALVVSIAVLRPLSSSKNFYVSPQQRTGRQRGRRFSNRTELTTCPPPQKHSRPRGEYLIFARYLKRTRFVLLSYYMHPY